MKNKIRGCENNCLIYFLIYFLQKMNENKRYFCITIYVSDMLIS